MALVDAATKQKTWRDLLELEAIKVVKDDSFVAKYDAAKEAALNAGDVAKKITIEFREQGTPKG